MFAISDGRFLRAGFRTVDRWGAAQRI